MQKKLALTLVTLLLVCTLAFSSFAGGYEGDMSLTADSETVPVVAPVSEGEPVVHAEVCEFCKKGNIHYYKQTKNEDWTTLKYVDCTHSMGYKHRIERATITAYYKCDNDGCGSITQVQNYDFYYRTFCYLQQAYSPGALGD